MSNNEQKANPLDGQEIPKDAVELLAEIDVLRAFRIANAALQRIDQYVDSKTEPLQFRISELEARNKVLTEALTTTHDALKDLVRQLPTDERLADYELDFAEHADFKAEQALKQNEG